MFEMVLNRRRSRRRRMCARRFATNSSGSGARCNASGRARACSNLAKTFQREVHRRTRASSRRQHLLHFVDQLAQVDRLGKHLGVLRRTRVGIERDRGKTGDEHDLDVGIELGGAAREFDAVHLRHDDIGEQQLERLLAQTLIGGKAVVVGHDLVAGVLQRLDQEPAHVDVVFRKQDFGHGQLEPGFRRPPSFHKPDGG